ncbi:hypothetical protein F2P81_015905 [Scophthalmus maximus]|uniref:Uncharacterized protein n=1 Tax=Scophthalmus maximus TaxID=52904 RepID=A0A6A4SHK3_SCOMX|nr:hypothetical protein F2P81_015905 [Scophthalmus maximus]
MSGFHMRTLNTAFDGEDDDDDIEPAGRDCDVDIEHWLKISRVEASGAQPVNSSRVQQLASISVLAAF